MRTTVTLDDELYESVRRRAFEQRRTLGDVINELVEKGLAESTAHPRVLGAFVGEIAIADDFDDTPAETDAALDEPVQR